MTKKPGALLIIVCLTSMAAWCQADTEGFDRVYTRANLSGLYGGVSGLYLTSGDWDDGYGVGLELGYRFAHDRAAALRHGPNLESGFYTIKSRLAGQRADFEMIPLMANYRVGAEVVDGVWIFGGGGAGYGFVDIDPSGMSGGTDQTSMWQLFLGIEGPINEWASLRGGYRHLWVDEMKHGDARIRSDDASIFEVGFNFWY